MRREFHVRFCEGPGVQFPRAIRLVMGFQHESDASLFRAALEERLRRFNLELHPEKTRLLRFGTYAQKRQQERGLGKAGTFDFLGLTHICGRSRAGKFLLFRYSSKKRIRAKLHAIREALLRRRHRPIPEQGAWLASVVRGYFAYFAVPTNARRICSFRYEVVRSWLRALRRRGQHDRTPWSRMQKLAERWIPPPHILHPWPDERFHASTQGRSRVR
jgi:RNA-directed DNA polymerase